MMKGIASIGFVIPCRMVERFGNTTQPSRAVDHLYI
jgi:hypothetical protein